MSLSVAHFLSKTEEEKWKKEIKEKSAIFFTYNDIIDSSITFQREEETEAVHSISIVGDAMALPLIEALEKNLGRLRQYEWLARSSL